MTLREILQIELWSKTTSRKLLVWVGRVCGTVIVVGGAWIAVEHFWTTPGERKAGRQALAQIDALQKFESMSGNDFSIGDARAREEIAVARSDARTQRDLSLANGLEEYLDMTESDRQLERSQKLIWKMSPDMAAKAEDGGKHSELGAEARLKFRIALHRALD
jgi:hypothetical protein